MKKVMSISICFVVFLVMVCVMIYVTGVYQEGVLPRIKAYQEKEALDEVVDSSASESQSESLNASDSEPVNSSASIQASGRVPAQLEPDLANQPELTSPQANQPTGSVQAAPETKVEEPVEPKAAETMEITDLGSAPAYAGGAREKKEADEQKRNTGAIKLAKLYGSMKPNGAAKVLETMDKTTVAKIILSMSDRKAANVLEAMDLNYAAQVSKELEHLIIAENSLSTAQ